MSQRLRFLLDTNVLIPLQDSQQVLEPSLQAFLRLAETGGHQLMCHLANLAGLRAFLAVLGDSDVGLFVSLGGFTKDAASEARLHPTRKLTLIDMRRFLELWVQYYAKLDDDVRQKLPLRPIYFLAPLE